MSEPMSEIEKVTDEDTYLRVGKRVVCEWFRTKPWGTFSLAGMQTKTTGWYTTITGEIVDITGEGDRANPVNIKVHVLVSEEMPKRINQIPGEESLIGTIVCLDIKTIKQILPSN